MSAIFVSLLIVVVGFALSFGGSWYRDKHREKGDKRSIANTLLVEIRAQAKWCRTRGSLWNLRARDGARVALKDARQDRPPRSEVYEAMVGRMTLFEPGEIASLTAFHGAVDAIRSRIDGWSALADGEPLEANDIEDLALKWREACHAAALAIEILEQNVEPPRSIRDSVEKDALLRDIKRVAEGGILLTHSAEAGKT